MEAKKLLFVDDEPAIRVTLPAILEKEGFEIRSAATVAEALEYITKERFDILLADLNIGQPGDGFTVVSAMRRTQPEAVTLILTGYPDFDTALQALRDQVDDYLTKPADIQHLISTIREKLNQPLRRRFSPIKRVSTVLRENSSQILEQWYKAVSNDRDLSRIQLTRNERVDHIPKILQELGDRVDADRFEASYLTLEAARVHGRQRREQGYRVPQVIAEGRILHTVICRCLHSHLLSIDLSTFTSDLVRIGEGLHEQLEESARAFAAAIRILSIAYTASLEKTRAELLRREGYDVESALGTEEGKRLAETTAFDLFVIGHAAPQAERTNLMNWVKSRFPSASIVMLTRPHETSFPDGNCSAEADDPEKVLEAVNDCAHLIPPKSPPPIRKRDAATSRSV